MDRWQGKVAFVTGASAGIGAAIAEELAKAGVVVVALARRLEKLQELSASLEGARGKLYPRQCDVTKTEELLEAFRWVECELGGVDILVNNAGVGKNSKIIDDDVESFRKILDVNVLATAVSIREAVASMKRRDVPGYIININSVVGHYLPTESLSGSLYSSSKFALTALTEVVRRELAMESNSKIRITSISPGVVTTEFAEAAGYGSVSDGILKDMPSLDSKDIADSVLYVLGTRGKVQVTELTIRPAGENF